MTSSATPGALCFPSVLPGPSRSRWLGLVCPVDPFPLSPFWSVSVLPILRVARAAPDRRSPPLGNRLTVVATIGSAPQTR